VPFFLLFSLRGDSHLIRASLLHPNAWPQARRRGLLYIQQSYRFAAFLCCGLLGALNWHATLMFYFRRVLLSSVFMARIIS
jgi:hypothetical protein